MAEQQLFRGDMSEDRRRLSAAVNGASQIWDSYVACIERATPETIRQITNRVVDQLNQVADQLERSSGERGQSLGSNR